MRTLLIAAASAVFFAAVITEIYSRLWPGSYVALLVLCAVTLFLSGLLNLRLASLGRPAPAQPAAERQSARGERPGGTGGSGGRRDGGGEGQRESGRGRGGRDGTRGRGERERQAPARGGAADSGARREPAPAAAPGPRETGTVKWFNRNKGFGFVIRESGEEIFVHQRSIRPLEDDGGRRPALRDGQSVTFVVAERDKGLQAEDVVGAEE
ncbi:MAG: cold shock domain-containing protein [Pseudomonadales bacterium]